MNRHLLVFPKVVPRLLTPAIPAATAVDIHVVCCRFRHIPAAVPAAWLCLSGLRLLIRRCRAALPTRVCVCGVPSFGGFSGRALRCWVVSAAGAGRDPAGRTLEARWRAAGRRLRPLPPSPCLRLRVGLRDWFALRLCACCRLPRRYHGWTFGTVDGFWFGCVMAAGSGRLG